MKKITFFICALILNIGTANAAVRNENATNRTAGNAITNNVSRTATTTKTLSNRSAQNTVSRGDASVSAAIRNTAARTNSNAVRTTSARSAIIPQNISARTTSAGATTSILETRTGAEYDLCKNTYFSCMDQFCQYKNDDYRRCSCSNRVYDLEDARDILQDAGDKLTVFTENLDAVGMTAAQATAMKTASDGENALTSDSSASKALLNAIMNSIRGEDTSVAGKYSSLNSIDISFDTTNAFGTIDAGQAIATYNGQNLYSAVYPQCREAVKTDCNDASLQRAITAYLMAIEQDCNTVQTAIEEKQKQAKSAVRESSAMLDLARVENRQKHNSDDMSTCIANVEAAILSEEVCGKNYHKCLDNGEFIDLSTGAPIAGVEKFYELEELLTFSSGVDSADQKLSQSTKNRSFMQNFESRTKKFAAPALDKCTEMADIVWAEYLDKALLDIFYAQKAKVAEVKQGCFDFISQCYTNSEDAITAAMKGLTGDDSVILQPDSVSLSQALCQDYINSCDYMFDNNIISEYINNRQETDTITACRAVVRQCFDKYGGTNYENYYYPYSGLFTQGLGNAPDWFTLYEYTDTNTKEYKSDCAKQLTTITSCNDPEIIEEVFGGFDKAKAIQSIDTETQTYIYTLDFSDTTTKSYYGIISNTTLNHRNIRSTGVATEVYNQIIDNLTTQCTNLQGRFVEPQFIKIGAYDMDNYCKSTFSEYPTYAGNTASGTTDLLSLYSVADGENMCPRDYALSIDTQSWGACLCWENGGRRSKWGKAATCVNSLPVSTAAEDEKCNASEHKTPSDIDSSFSIDNWCTKSASASNQICPLGSTTNNGGCVDSDGNSLTNLPAGLSF